MAFTSFCCDIWHWTMEDHSSLHVAMHKKPKEKKQQYTGMRCAACGKHSFRHFELRFFRFPLQSVRSQQWIEACGREDLKGKSTGFISRNFKMCSDHFAESMYTNPRLRNRLLETAVPTIFNGRTTTFSAESTNDNKIVTSSCNKAKEQISGFRTAKKYVSNNGTGGKQKYSLPFFHGWKRLLVYRSVQCSTTARKQSDVYYLSPDGKKLRSTREVSSYLEMTNSPLSINYFSFAQAELCSHLPGAEIVKTARCRRRISNLSSKHAYAMQIKRKKRRSTPERKPGCKFLEQDHMYSKSPLKEGRYQGVDLAGNTQVLIVQDPKALNIENPDSLPSESSPPEDMVLRLSDLMEVKVKEEPVEEKTEFHEEILFNGLLDDSFKETPLEEERREEIKQLKERIELLEKEEKSLLNKNATLEEDNKSLLNETATLKKENESLLNKNARLEEELLELKAHTAEVARIHDEVNTSFINMSHSIKKMCTLDHVKLSKESLESMIGM